MPAHTDATASFPIWTPGEFEALDGRAFEFTAGALTSSAAAYDPARFRAPWVKGLPKTEDPAQGWADPPGVRKRRPGRRFHPGCGFDLGGSPAKPFAVPYAGLRAAIKAVEFQVLCH